MKKFREYLEHKNFKLNTLRGHISNVKSFISWIGIENLQVAQISYTDLLVYLDYLKTTGVKKHTINLKLCSIRYYFDSLEERGKVKNNPVATLRLKNVIRRTPHQLLSKEKLEQIYLDFEAIGICGKRNQLILSLVVFQGLNSTEIQALELEDLELEKGQINIPDTNRSNGRIMKLEAVQVMDFNRYILNVRPFLLKIKGKDSNKLFVSTGARSNLQNVMPRIVKQIQEEEGNYSFKQIRASVISNWMNSYGIKEVQYLAGHKYSSSTENYKQSHLKDLTELLKKFHPLK